MTRREASKAGYKAVTFPYEAGEDVQMKKVVADLERGGIEYAIVDADKGKEVWRK